MIIYGYLLQFNWKVMLIFKLPLLKGSSRNIYQLKNTQIGSEDEKMEIADSAAKIEEFK